LGNDALLPVITSVVLGGTNIMGGEGTILGTSIAVVPDELPLLPAKPNLAMIISY